MYLAARSSLIISVLFSSFILLTVYGVSREAQRIKREREQTRALNSQAAGGDMVWIPTGKMTMGAITGAPAELVQEVSPALLRGLWRRAFGVAPTPPPTGRIGLYRAPCGLMFFAPAEAGDGAFYDALYRRLDAGGRVRGAARLAGA